MFLGKSCIWDKSFSRDIAQNPSANQIAGFLNQEFLQNKLMKQPHFLHIDTSSQKLKVDLKWVQPTWSLDSKIDCFSRMK